MGVPVIRKRDGSTERYDESKIKNAIHRALFETGLGDDRTAARLAGRVSRIIAHKFRKRVPNVEDVQDVVVGVLERWEKKAGEAYSDYRKKKSELRSAFGFDEKLSYNAMAVLEKRYLIKGPDGRIESPAMMFRRVARAVAAVEKGNGKRWKEDFYRIMANLEFLPNSPALFNAGTGSRQLSACFVLPIEDSLESIFDAVKSTALIEQTGGGVGFSFSRLRPKGDIVKSTQGVASGPVSFMKEFDTTTEVVKSGGKRRGAMMGVLGVEHPDIMDFISAKSRGGLSNFNLSVAVTDKFMKAAKSGGGYQLINPRTGKPVKKMDAKKVWAEIVRNAWETGDPGVIFIDEINRKDQTGHIGKIESTNPCGEAPLHPYESCTLGSINLTKMVKGSDLDWEKLKRTVRLAVRFLDNIISVNKYPLPEIEKATKANRRIGLGVMGFADMLVMLGIPYSSDKALKLGGKIMKFISEESHRQSQAIGKEKGSFPNFTGSSWSKKVKHMRNATTTVIAPTGTISIIAGCSSGIEPLFAVSYVRKVLEGRELLEMNRLFEKEAKERGFYSAKLMLQIAGDGSVQKIKKVPAELRKVFITALDIKPEWHVKMQAEFQKHTDGGVSKTVNLPEKAKPSEVKKVFETAHKLKCKGITVYRYGSRKDQVLYMKGRKLVAEHEYSGGCPTGKCPSPA